MRGFRGPFWEHTPYPAQLIPADESVNDWEWVETRDEDTLDERLIRRAQAGTIDAIPVWMCAPEQKNYNYLADGDRRALRRIAKGNTFGLGRWVP